MRPANRGLQDTTRKHAANLTIILQLSCAHQKIGFLSCSCTLVSRHSGPALAIQLTSVASEPRYLYRSRRLSRYWSSSDQLRSPDHLHHLLHFHTHPNLSTGATVLAPFCFASAAEHLRFWQLLVATAFGIRRPCLVSFDSLACP